MIGRCMCGWEAGGEEGFGMGNGSFEDCLALRSPANSSDVQETDGWTMEVRGEE